MDSCESFIEALGQAISTRDFTALTSILKSSQEFLAIISVEHREPIVYAVFDGRNSLLCFYENEFRDLQRNRIIDNALTQGFYFLDFFIKNFYTIECFAKYILKIKKVCQSAMIKKCCSYTQKAACNVFTKLIELFGDHDLELSETITTFVKPLNNAYSIQERKLIFCVLSKIIKHNGNICASQIHLTLIFQQLFSDVKKYELNNLPNDFHIYFDVFADILDSIEPPNEIRHKLFCKFYEWIKDISQSDREQPIVLRSAIDLLSRHINLFQDYLYPDCQYWYNVLRRLSLKTTASGECGQRALKSFYRVIGRILTERDDTDTRKLLVYFLEEFEKEFKNTDLDLTTLQLVVYGFSQMAAPCKLRLDQFNIRHMYSIITSYALPLCSSEQSNSIHIENICCYQKALAEILCHMTDVTFENINVLIKLSTYAIKRFPDLVISNNALAVSSLIKTMNKLGTINKSLLQQYLDNIIYDGIAWSCSHTLALDAVLQQELNNLEQSPICYKNYLPLWTELLNVERYLTHGCEQMVQHVANTLINVCITLIGRLDIRLKQINKDTAYSDVARTQSALNQADFRVFTNLVDLYVDVIDASESSLFINTVCKFLYEIIRLSYRYPLISGFYKLVRTGMKIFVTYTLKEEEDIGESQRMKELLSNYLTRTLDLIPTFSNELLITCLYLILDAPHTYFKDALPSTLPAFRIAFTVGLSNLELAYNALVTLETWTEQERKQERTNELLREIVVYLEPYLRSTESSVEVSQDLTVTRTRSRVRRVEVIDTDCMLRNFQRQVLLFLGSLDHDLLLSFVHDRASRSTGTSWDRKDLVKYTLPLPDARPDIHFDRMLPRIIALARESSDRRTKIAACEVLHSIMTLIIGSTARYLSNRENRFIALYDTLCPVMLVLGCDSDEVVRGLFQPLTLQLMHWLSSSSTFLSPVLKSLFDSLTDDSNPALREFSGMCLAEFTRWSIKQALEMQESQPNVQQIIRKINEFALHPSMRKRIAAAVAFNHLYAILREDNDTVSIYWLEIFYCFVCSLNDECDDPSIANALAHVEKVMRLKADLLNRIDPNRREPHEFEGATLTHALYWLLSRCGTLDERCRAKCMELYVNISQYIDNYPQETIQIFIETYGMDRLNDIVLRGLESGVKDISIIDNVMPFLKALDCYIWLIENQLLSIETLFPATDDAREHTIFSCIRSFTYQFWRITTENFAAEAIAINSRELEQLQTLQYKTLMATLNFIQMLLNINMNLLSESLWDESLSALTIKCIIFPRSVGFDVRNIEMTDKLPHILEILLNTMKSRFTDALPNTFNSCLLNFGRKYVARLLNLNYIAQNNLNDDLIQHVKGLILLQRCNMLDPMILEKSAFENGERTVECIFKFLVNERFGEWICSNLNARMIEYLRTLMDFQLSLFSLTIETPIMVIPNDVRSITETLMKLISNDTLIIGADSAQITHGEYFLNMFKDAIFRFMLTHVGAITLVFDEMSRDNPSFLLKWLEDLMLYLKQHKREFQAHVDAITNAILRHFMCLKSAACDDDSGRERLMNIYGIVVRLNSEPVKITRDSAFPELYKWILSQLNDHCGLEYKIQILQRFFICLTDVTIDYGDNENPELQVILQSLNEEKKKLCSNLSETSVNAMKVTNCFETLMILVSTTRSKIILKCVIHFAAGTGDHLFRNEKIEEHLRECYREASSEHALRLLKITYEVFMNRDIYLSETDRLDVLRGFLLPTFKVCETIAIERFFEQNIRELHDLTNLRIDVNTDKRNVKQILVSKIGCFEIITIMFASVDTNKIVGVDATIALNALHHLKTGKELIRSLYTCANNTRALKITQSGCNELMRLLYCSAYNCELAIISLKEDECTYRRVFGENYSRGLLIWGNIIDCSKRYQLGQTFKKYPKIREVAVNIKSTAFTVDDRYSYVHSYDLSACTLCEDINAYDFNRSVLLPLNRHQSTSARNLGDSHGASVVLESDDFNKHECMPYICVLLRRIREICVPNNELPQWLQFFLDGLTMYDHPNIRLFMLRIIWNMVDDVFKPYARFMLTPIIKAVASYLERYDLNYIITDILEMLMDWHDVAVPSDENDRTQAQRLFEAFINKALVETSNEQQTSNEQRVYDYNLSLMKIMVEKWHSYLRVPHVLLTEKMTSAPKAAVYLISVLLRNDMTEEIIARNDIVNFLLKPLRDWNIPEKVTLPCSECLGLYLKSLDKRDEIERKIMNREVREKIIAVLGFMQPYGNIIKQVKRVAVLCRNYPEVATDYIHVMLNAIAKNLGRDYCLEIFALSMPRLSASDDKIAILNNLRHIDLEKVLKNQQVSFCAKLALRIVGDLVTIISPSDLLPYVKSTIPYIKDVNTEHREFVYDILMKVYRKYSADTLNDDAIRLLLSISVENLLTGLLDPSHELQDRILRFWTEETRLSTERSKNRLLGLLTMHSMLQITTSTSEEDAFAPFIALLMLQLVTKSMDYNKNVFDAPLHDKYTFENYKVAVSWRRRNLSCMTPMFVDSLASQMSTFSQISTDADLHGTRVDSYSHFLRFSGVPLRLRATQDLQFEPTLDDTEAADATFDSEFDRSTIASSSRQSLQDTTMRRRPFRILENSSDVANVIRRKQIQKNMQRREKMKQESIRQRSSVRLYRDYRIGDFPDIEIPHSSLIVPLQQLIKLDRLICKDMIVSLFCSLIEETTKREKSDDFRQAVVDHLKRISHDSSERDSSFNAVVLETLLQLNVTDSDPRDIAKVSKISRLDVLGTLLLERSLLPDSRNDDLPTSSKRMRRCEETDNEETDKWVQLASLYKSLNDVDVVLNIFRRQRFFGDDMQKAAFAEVNGDWIQAKDAYTSAYKRIENRSIKEHCFQGLFEAVENLCDWSAIDQLVKSRTNDGNLNGIWDDTWKDWMLPYAFDAYVHMLEERKWRSVDDDLEVIQSWMDDRDKSKYLKHLIGTDLMIFLMMSEEMQRHATDLLNELLDKTRERWVGLSPLCIERGICESLKLQAMNDLNASLSVLRCTNEATFLNRLDALLNFWSSKVPAVQDNLVQWNKLAAYRMYSSMLFENIFNDMKEDHDEDRKRAIIERMRRSSPQLRQAIADAALHQKHQYIAEKHLSYMNYRLREIYNPHLELPLELLWLDARIKCLHADIETDARIKMSDYTASWESSHRLLNECDELGTGTNIFIRQHVGVLASKIESSSRENAEFADALASNVAILQEIGIAESTHVDPNNIREYLLRYSYNNLRACCEDAVNTAATNIGEHYCALARHCYGRLMSIDMENDEVFHEFLLSTLRAMRYDYLEAAHYFPCLLRPERLQDEKTRVTFVRECAELQPWLFLRWRDLLFSHLNTSSIANLIVPIVERLAEAYPDAIAYTYHLVIERNPSILQDGNVQRMHSLLRDKAEKYGQFLRAIQYVARPELYLKYYLDEAMRDLTRGRGAAAIESLLQKVYPNTQTAGANNPRPGNIYQTIAQRYEREIRALNPDDLDATRKEIQSLKKSLDEDLLKYASKTKLNDYSPFLHEYTGGSIEVPGQYTGDREPILRYHARIARFEPCVAVMQSLRKPICIGIVGNNGKEYKFLVKFGEDLTIDRGLQQLYTTMNRTLRNDASCRQRRLSIDTYEVIPLSRSFGLIQWIENTKSLKDLIHFTLSKKESDRCESIHNKYKKWITNASKKSRLVDQYKEAVSKYNCRTVTEQMERFVGETRRTALRDAFVAVSPSPECFATLRRNFVASYATMCVAHWLADVGDRNLQNTLVRVTTGRCLGIDFGHAFGGGMRTLVPEFVPFRLTPQILELLRPFTERDLLATIMTHAMRALRDDRGPILACMDIFVHKPVNRLSLDDETTNDDDQDDADLTWSSKRNIEIVAKKLNGIHPSLITLQQLKEAHDDEYFTRYHAIVIGDDGTKQARANIKNDCLTPAEQVDCLLDQAKDFNILGRMYANWQSWL